MAKPLEFTPRPATPHERLHSEIEDAAPALEESLRLLRELHEHGVLELLIKVVRGGEGLAEGTLNLLGSERTLIGLRNLVELAKVLGNVHPDDIRLLSEGLGTAARQGALNAARHEQVTPLEIPGKLLDPDIQLALGTIFALLKGLGQGLRTAQEPHPVGVQTRS